MTTSPSYTSAQLRLLLKEAEEREAALPKTCRFVSTKPNPATLRNTCDAPATVSYGEFHYCLKHSNTAQALRNKPNGVTPSASTSSTTSTAATITHAAAPAAIVAQQQSIAVVEEETPHKSSKDHHKKKPAKGSSSSEADVQKKISVKKNKFGNFTHELTHLIFNPKTRLAIGVEQSNGKMRAFRQADLKVCRKWGFSFEKPEWYGESSDESGGDEDEDDEPQVSKSSGHKKNSFVKPPPPPPEPSSDEGEDDDDEDADDSSAEVDSDGEDDGSQDDGDEDVSSSEDDAPPPPPKSKHAAKPKRR